MAAVADGGLPSPRERSIRRLTSTFSLNDADRLAIARNTVEEIDDLLCREAAEKVASRFGELGGSSTPEAPEEDDRAAPAPAPPAADPDERALRLQRGLRRSKLPPPGDRMDVFRRARRVKMFGKFGSVVVPQDPPTPSASSTGPIVALEDDDNLAGEPLWLVVDSLVRRRVFSAAAPPTAEDPGARRRRPRASDADGSLATCRLAGTGLVSAAGARARTGLSQHSASKAGLGGSSGSEEASPRGSAPAPDHAEAAAALLGGGPQGEKKAASDHNALWSKFWMYYRRGKLDAPPPSAVVPGCVSDGSGSEESDGSDTGGPARPSGGGSGGGTARSGNASAKAAGGIVGSGGSPTGGSSARQAPGRRRRRSSIRRRGSAVGHGGAPHEDSKKEQRRGGVMVALPMIGKAEECKKDAFCFAGYDDYKQHQRWMSEHAGVSVAKHDLFRPGLALNRLPDEASMKGIASLQAAARARELDLATKEVIATSAMQPPQRWTANEREFLSARANRARRERFLEMQPATPMKLTAGRPEPPAMFRRPWERPMMLPPPPCGDSGLQAALGAAVPGGQPSPQRDSLAQPGGAGSPPARRRGSQAASRRASCDQDARLGPLRRFADICSKFGVHPHTESVKFLLQLPPKLDLRAAGYGDSDVIALASALAESGGSLEAVDLGENARLSDAAAVALLRALVEHEQHAISVRRLHLDRCPRLGRETVALCADLLPFGFPELQMLNLGGVGIGMREYMMLSVAVSRHRKLTDIRLAETGLGRCDASEILRNLISNPQLEVVDLGWNSLGAAAFEVLGQGVVEHAHLQMLGLSNTSGTISEMFSPLLGFMELLAGDRTLTALDVSMNSLGGGALLVMESAFRSHPRLQLIDVSRNSFGLHGCRALLRLLASTSCPELRTIKADDCGSSGAAASLSSAGLFSEDPSGRYAMDMRDPVMRSMLRLLVARLLERAPGSSPSAFLRNCSLAGGGSQERFSVDSLKQTKHGVTVPTSGELRFDLDFGAFLVTPDDAAIGSGGEAVLRMIARRRRTLVGKRKVLAVLEHIKSVVDDYIRDDLLEALSYDFILTQEQAKSLCHTKMRTRNCGHDPVGTCARLLPTLMDPLSMREHVLATESVRDLVRLEQGAVALLNVNFDNPTGHYDLNLAEPAERVVAERLLLLNRWQGQRWKAAGLVDISQHGNGKCTRNEVHLQRRFLWGAEEWVLPEGGIFSFDFVPLLRPSADATTISDQAWTHVLREVRLAIFRPKGMRASSAVASPMSSSRKDSTISLDSTRRRGGVLAPRTPTSPRSPKLGSKFLPSTVCGVAMQILATDVHWVLRSVSAEFWLTCRQLRNLLLLFHHVEQRCLVLTTLVLRCVDWPINSKLVRAVFQQADWALLQSRLGYVLMFPFFQPEHTLFTLDLAMPEQRRCLHQLVRYSGMECPGGGNMKTARIDRHGPSEMPKYEVFTAGIPMTWDSLDAIPTAGVVEVTYTCMAEHAKLKVRRRAAHALGGWAGLAEDPTVVAAQTDWWCVLGDIGEDVVRVMVFVMTTFSCLDEVFNACDTNKDGKLNLQEFVGNLRAIGCGKLNRRHNSTASSGVSGSVASTPPSRGRTANSDGSRRGRAPLANDMEDHAEEVLTSVFRFLDPNNKGEIRRREFAVLERLWRELIQAALDFKRHLEDLFGSTESFWLLASEDGNLPWSAFETTSREFLYHGPLRGIFLYLDKDSNERVCKNEWDLLDALDGEPRERPSALRLASRRSNEPLER